MPEPGTPTRLERASGWGWGKTLAASSGLIVVLVVIAAVACEPSEDESYGAIDGNSREATEYRSERAKTQEERRRGHHCLSAWDGNHEGFERLIRAELNDPGSMSTTRTVVGTLKDGRHEIRLFFTAKNALGSRVQAIGVGSFRNSDCKATLRRIAE